MKKKQWFSLWFGTVLSIIFVMILVNYSIDPLQQYRIIKLGKIIYDGDKERELNAGLAKHYDYHSILIGSSMTENFLLSDLESIVDKPIKLCISGAKAKEISITLQTAFDNKKNINNIVLGLDLYSLAGQQKINEVDFPLYLYKSTLFGQLRYLLNLETIKKSLKVIQQKRNMNNSLLTQYEYMYQWQHLHEGKFKYTTLQDMLLVSHKLLNTTFSLPDWDVPKLKDSFEVNILQHIRNHKATKFIVFFPPYSIATYMDWKYKGILENAIEAKFYIANQLSKESNVILYDFQLASEVIENIENYKDYTHYHQKINSWMVQQIKEEKNHFIVDIRSYSNQLTLFKELIDGFYAKSYGIYEK